jgi:carbohydrate kinase (thermoresistant glucokinase family)
MDDLDPGKADSVGDLAACLRHLRRCAGEPSYRALEQKTIHASGFLPGTRLERVRLARSTLSDVLNGRKFPRKAFVLTLVEALNVDLVADHRWGHAWDQLAVRDQQAGPAAEEVERLRLENEELRQRLAEAGYQAGAARARTQDQPGRHLAAAGERAGEGRQDAFDPDVIRQWLDLTPTPTMRSLTELRRAIEPAAAFLAAQRPSADVCRDLVLLSRQLQELGEDGRFSEDNPAGRRIREGYQDVDARFHEALLKGSQNEMFYALKDLVRQALSYRIHRGWEGARGLGPGAGGTTRFPPRPAPLALWLHRGLAAAVGQGNPEAAETFSRAILAEIGTHSLPPADGDALEHALTLLDPGPVDAAGGAGWERFQHAIQAAVLSSRASAALDGPAVIIGVAGCGKTTIGQLLAGSLRVPYAEADSFHPAGNVAKMEAGTALTDQDRGPWLAAIAGRIRQDSRVVVSCSALKRSYRDVLRQAGPRAWFLHLKVDRETAAARVAGRAAHFMPASLVDSQFADLEPLREEEAGLTVDGTLPPEQILAAAIRALAAPSDWAPAPARSSSPAPGTCQS